MPKEVGKLLRLRDELISSHALHIGLNDGLGMTKMAMEGGGILREEIIAEKGVGLDVVIAKGTGAVKKEEMMVLDVLIDAVVVVDGPREGVGGMEKVNAIGEEGGRGAREGQDGGHDVGLLRDGIAHADGEVTRGGVENDRDGEGAEGSVVGWLFSDIGVVGSDDEEGVVVPRHTTGSGEEATEGMVGVADAGVEGMAGSAEAVGVARGDSKGVMGGGGEDSGHERLREGVHGGSKELQELLIPDGPSAVEVVFATKTGVGIVFGASEIVLEAGGAGECLKAHRAVFGTMEEGCGVALF